MNDDSQIAMNKNAYSKPNKIANGLLNEPSLDDDHLLPSEISQLLLDSALIIYEQLKPPKRSTGSSVSSERSIDDQSDEDNLDVICQQVPTPQTNIIKQPKVSNVLPTISATIPTLLDLNRDLSRDLNRNLEREINNIHHHHSTKLNLHRTPAGLIDNKRLMRELMFDADCGLSKLKETKLDSKSKMMISGNL